MRISLLRISLLRFFKKINKFALCEFMPYALSYFISLVRFFGYFCPIWQMRILANANFFQNQKSHQARTLCTYKPRPLDFLQCSGALTNESLTKKFTSLPKYFQYCQAVLVCNICSMTKFVLQCCEAVNQNAGRNPNGLIRSSSFLEKKYLRTLP